MKKKEILKLDDSSINKLITINGTNFDRRRKVNPKNIKKMIRRYECGKTFTEIAKEFNMSAFTVRYNIDPIFRDTYNVNRQGKSQKNYHKDIKTELHERAIYKRQLVKEGKIKC